LPIIAEQQEVKKNKKNRVALPVLEKK